VSALGHYLEEEGIPTVAISLIRAQTENTKPPRALWVPFELGRPLGPPSDPAFQKRVILAALRLLEVIEQNWKPVCKMSPPPAKCGSILSKNQSRSLIRLLDNGAPLPPGNAAGTWVWCLFLPPRLVRTAPFAELA